MKDEILLSDIGSRIAEINLKPNISITRFMMGESIVAMVSNRPVEPIAFFISKLLARIKSKPSDRYPPSNGM